MAFDTYIKLEGIDGESNAKGVEKQVEIYSFSWGASNPTSAMTSGGGAHGAGKVSVSSFNLMKKLDKASAKLFQNCCTGTSIPTAQVTMRKAAGTQTTFLTYKFTEVFVESVQWSGSSGGDDTPTESLSLAFSKVEIEYSTVDAKGTATKAGQASWDLKTNSAS